MKCVFLVTKGERIEGAEELRELGYQVEEYPTTQDAEDLADTRCHEFHDFLGINPRARDSSYVRSLRKSFARMLRDAAYEEDDLVIFGESDATPTIEAGILREKMMELVQQYPQVDVFRLFYDLRTTPAISAAGNRDVEFQYYKTRGKTLGIPYVWGTHAMVIPASKREKVAEIFETCVLPIDTAIEAVTSNGDLKVMVANRNLFYQKPRTSRACPDMPASYCRDRKIAVCLASYKRLEDLQRQIFSMMNQTYRNLHLFVAAKGITEYACNMILKPQFQRFIDEGRLTLRCFPNKNQLSNFIDTIRDIDVDEYELFAKIDDDDFYSHRYFETINDFHKKIPPHHSSYFCGNNFVNYKKDGFPVLSKEQYYVFGSSMVMTRRVMAKLIECEKNPDNIPQIVPTVSRKGLSKNFGFSEDNLMDMALQEEGADNIEGYLRSQHINFHILVQKSNHSVMRGGLLSDRFLRENTAVSNDEKHHEHVAAVQHPDWNGVMKIMNGRAVRLGQGDEADVLTFSDSTLELKWDKWGTETFIKNDLGLYVLKKDA